MNPERQRQIMRVLEAAQELAAGARPAFLDEACAGDQTLRREVESLLAADGKASRFMAGPALQDAAKLLAEQATLLDDANAAGDPYATTTPGMPGVPLAPGVMLDGRYLIERELGRGGIGVVFLARDRRLHDRPVVVKALLETRLNGEARAWFEKKFRDEVNALARIEDPGVVHPIDAGQLANGRAYLVMEYVEGQPLGKIIAPSGLALPRVARLLRQIARALAAAHAKGIVHRDLTPNNILLQNPGEAEQIKLIDFGLATVREALAASRPLTTMVAGTPPYMAPEQMRGAPEKASDIYALGVLAYQLVTGRLPFAGKSLIEIAAAQQAGIQTLPCALRPDLPLQAEAAILQALALEPEERYASATAFSEDFQRGLAESGDDPYQTSAGALAVAQSDSLVQPAWRGRWWWLGGGVLAALLLGALAWHFLPTNVEQGAPVPAPVALPVAAARTVSYSIWLRRAARPRDVQTILPRDVIGKAGDDFRINVSSPQAGYLYLLNEWQAQPLEYDVMFPTGGSTEVRAAQVLQIPPPSGRPEKDWFYFDPKGVADKIWLIWSVNEVPELEAVKRLANEKDKGEIGDRAQVEAVRRYLAEHAANAPAIETDETTKQTKLTGKGPVLVGLITLKYR